MRLRLRSRFFGIVFAGIEASILVACGAPEAIDSDTSKIAESTSLQLAADEFAVAGRKPSKQPSAHIEKIIGQNDLLRVVENGERLLNQKGESAGIELPEIFRAKLDAFGHMSMGCTATHIGDGLVLSAGHCFRAPKNRASNKECGSVTVKWGQRHDKREYLITRCTEILAYQLNDDTDYAIFRVDAVPRATIEVAANPAPNDTVVTIFGYPRGRPLEWSQNCKVRPAKSGNWGADQFSHQCDTEPGSSGATILDMQTGKIIGIHDGGIAPWNYGTHVNRIPLRDALAKAKVRKTDVEIAAE